MRRVVFYFENMFSLRLLVLRMYDCRLQINHFSGIGVEQGNYGNTFIPGIYRNIAINKSEII